NPWFFDQVGPSDLTSTNPLALCAGHQDVSVLTPADLDPTLLMWSFRKRADLAALPDYRVVVRFEFSACQRAARTSASCGLFLNDPASTCASRIRALRSISYSAATCVTWLQSTSAMSNGATWLERNC